MRSVKVKDVRNVGGIGASVKNVIKGMLWLESNVSHVWIHNALNVERGLGFVRSVRKGLGKLGEVVSNVRMIIVFFVLRIQQFVQNVLKDLLLYSLIIVLHVKMKNVLNVWMALRFAHYVILVLEYLKISVLLVNLKVVQNVQKTFPCVSAV